MNFILCVGIVLSLLIELALAGNTAVLPRVGDSVRLKNGLIEFKTSDEVEQNDRYSFLRYWFYLSGNKEALNQVLAEPKYKAFLYQPEPGGLWKLKKALTREVSKSKEGKEKNDDEFFLTPTDIQKNEDAFNQLFQIAHDSYCKDTHGDRYCEADEKIQEQEWKERTADYLVSTQIDPNESKKFKSHAKQTLMYFEHVTQSCKKDSVPLDPKKIENLKETISEISRVMSMESKSRDPSHQRMNQLLEARRKLVHRDELPDEQVKLILNPSLDEKKRIEVLLDLYDKKGILEAYSVYADSNLHNKYVNKYTLEEDHQAQEALFQKSEDAKKLILLNLFHGKIRQPDFIRRFNLRRHLLNLPMTVGQLDKSPIEVAGSAGKSALYDVELMVHHNHFKKDIPADGDGIFLEDFLNRSAMLANDPTQANPSDDLLDISKKVLRAFDDGKKVVSFVVQGGGHYTSIAIDRDTQKIVLVDSGVNIDTGISAFLDSPNDRLKRALIKSLNEVSGRMDMRLSFSSNKIESVATGQQAGDENCGIFALLNAHQMAKKADVQAYQEVTAALASGTLKSYSDIGKIGEVEYQGRKRLKYSPYNQYTVDRFRAETKLSYVGPAHSNGVYLNFANDFRKETQTLLSDLINWKP